MRIYGYFFNPRHQYSDSPHNDGEVLQGTINVIGRLSRSMDERIDAMIEMDRFKLKLDIYRDYDVKEAVTRMGPGSHWEQRFAEREALSSQIDLDDLFDEEHPLNAWVETRQERDVPEFDPRDCSWAEGELDGVEAGDPKLRVSEDQPLTLGPLFSLPRHSAILPETSRVPPTQPALRRVATQKEKSSKAYLRGGLLGCQPPTSIPTNNCIYHQVAGHDLEDCHAFEDKVKAWINQGVIDLGNARIDTPQPHLCEWADHSADVVTHSVNVIHPLKIYTSAAFIFPELEIVEFTSLFLSNPFISGVRS
ncbi:hypothetical protein Taro_012739 [Colocasia esculenta]|uniref:Uncharacterized protein n=1 Tax=Colocasia esculenta TaxID=4460 RepID=A0A843UK27_COLES|nr:hypothetical protein [Colocasia esculenta]